MKQLFMKKEKHYNKQIKIKMFNLIDNIIQNN